MVDFTADAVFRFVKDTCKVSDNNTGQIAGWGGSGFASLSRAPSGHGAPTPRMFVLFVNLKLAKVKNLLSAPYEKRVASGYNVNDAFGYEVVAVVGDLPDEDLAALKKQAERVVQVFDPSADDAKSQLEEFLNR